MPDVDLSPGSPAWMKLVTASKVGPILGVSSYKSPLSIWRQMKGLDPGDQETPAMLRGNLLEAGVLAWWHHEHPEAELVEAQPTCSLPGLPWALATPDEIVLVHPGVEAILEAKTASSWDAWGDPGTDEVPPDYAAQVMWQLAMRPTATHAYVAVLGPYLDFREYVIDRDDDLAGVIVDRCEAFHASLAAGEPPSLADHPADHRALCRQRLGEAFEGTVTLPRDLADAFVAVLEAEDAAPVVRSRVLEAMGSAKHAQDEAGVRLARQQAGRHGASLVRTLPKPARPALGDLK